MPFVKFIPFGEEREAVSTCRDAEHNPPGMLLMPPGTYVWECPSCGAKQTIHISVASWQKTAEAKYGPEQKSSNDK